MANGYKVICSGCNYRASWPTRERANADAAKHTQETNHSSRVQTETLPSTRIR